MLHIWYICCWLIAHINLSPSKLLLISLVSKDKQEKKKITYLPRCEAVSISVHHIE